MHSNLQRLVDQGLEFRFVDSGFQTRADEGDIGQLTGLGAVFNRWSQPLGWLGFVERIEEGAFKKTIRESDIRALWNHNSEIVLGRNRANTLALSEESEGLRYDIDMDLGNSRVNDAYRTVDRGDVNQSSFGFEVVREEWNWDADPIERTLLELRLWEVSPVTFPAYLDTEVETKSALGPALRGLSAATGRSIDDLFTAGTAGELRSILATEPDAEPVRSHSEPEMSEARKRRLHLVGRSMTRSR